MNNCGIYKITSPTGGVYIGQAKNLKRRLREYKKPSGATGQTALRNSFLKHGAENHQFDIIEYCSEDELNCSERFWQDEFDSVSRANLNCILQECNNIRRKMSETTIENMRTSKLGENNPMYGKKRTEESKKKQGDSIRGELNYNFGKKASEETKQRMSNFQKGKVLSEEHKAKIGRKGELHCNFGKRFSDEQKQKISKTKKENGLSKLGNNPRAIKVLDNSTGEIYGCQKEVLDTFNISKYIFLKILKTENPPFTLIK